MSVQAPLVMILAGGTGGHVYPALAVAEALRERGYRIAWLGTRGGLEARVVPAAGFTLHCLPLRGVRGKHIGARLLALAALVIALWQALRLVLRRSPGCVLGLGGYVAVPGGLAAWLLRKPLLIHEQNAVAGSANRLLYPLATRVMSGFPAAFGAQRDSEPLGNPVRREILQLAAEEAVATASPGSLRLLVLGGSLGARPLNRAVCDAWRRLQARGGTPGLSVWHQSGPDLEQEVLQDYGPLPADSALRVSAFIDDMAAAYRWCDLVLCRAGAITVAELSVAGRAAVLVPLPHAIDDHQTHNARALAERGAAQLLPQSELTGERLAALLHQFLADPAPLQAMAARVRELRHPDATRAICDRCEEVMHVRV